MYRPIAPGRSRGSSSSDSQVMATAGVPAMSAPCTARRAMSCPAVCASGRARPSAVAPSAETTSTRPRPYFSDRIEAGTTHSASAPVAAETVSAAVDGLTASSEVSVGSSACVAYKALKMASPNASMAHVARRYSGLPFCMSTMLGKAQRFFAGTVAR